MLQFATNGGPVRDAAALRIMFRNHENEDEIF